MIAISNLELHLGLITSDPIDPSRIPTQRF